MPINLYSNRVGDRLIQDCIAVMASGGGFLKVGYREGVPVGIPFFNEWLINFKKHFQSFHPPEKYEFENLIGEVEIIEGIKPHLKALIIPFKKYTKLEEWPVIKGNWQVRGDEHNETLINFYEANLWLKHFSANEIFEVDSRVAFYERIKKDREQNPRDLKGDLIAEIKMDQNKRTLVATLTDDGSKTLTFVELGETFHSTQGALEEAKHVFIKNGLEFSLEKIKQNTADFKGPLSILEIGLGTGLNALLSVIKSRDLEASVEYSALEPFPIPQKTIKELEYEKLNLAEDSEHLIQLIHSKNEGLIELNSNFKLTRVLGGLESLNEKEKFDFIYFDAFAPNKQFELWSLENLSRCFESLKKTGYLVSYCSKSLFKKNLKLAGFSLESISGPNGRREMIRAFKD